MNTTRRIQTVTYRRPTTTRRRPRLVIRKVERIVDSGPFKWSEFLIWGDNLFNYMIHNYNKMINDNNIYYFEITDYMDKFDKEAYELHDKYLQDIEKNLIPWIQNEYKTGRLFEKSNWKPFRDQYDLLEMYFGYNKYVQFKNYYFQLAISEGCCADDCLNCDENELNIHFELALFGWTEDGNHNLQPGNCHPIPSNNVIPEWYWKRK